MKKSVYLAGLFGWLTIKKYTAYPNMKDFKEYKIISGADLCFQEKSKHLIKYCPECIKEHGLYLLREHQIFEEGLKDEISVIKGKIRKRLKELGYLEYKNYSMEFNKFYTNLVLEENFSSKEKALDFVLKGCFDTKIKKAPSPVDFLFVIYKLFGSLEALYKYEICAKEVQQDKYPQNLKRVLDLEIKTGIIYWPTPLDALKYKKEAHQIRNYCIDKRIEGTIKIGTDGFIPKNAKYPDYKRFISNRETLITDTIPGKQYLTTREYAKKYSKSKERICILCREGKIKNVIKVKRRWLILEDAPYPFEKRLEE